MLVKNSQLLAALIVVLNNVALVRTLGRDGLRMTLARISKGARAIIHPLTCFKVIKVLTASETQPVARASPLVADRKSTRLNSSHLVISYAVFCLKKKNKYNLQPITHSLFVRSSDQLNYLHLYLIL